MSTLTEIEAALPNLSAEELTEVERLVREQLGKMSSGLGSPAKNLWQGARERLRRIWSERTLTESEVAEMRDFEGGE